MATGYVDRRFFDNEAERKARRVARLERELQDKQEWLDGHRRTMKNLKLEIDTLRRKIQKLGYDADKLDLKS